MKQVLDQIKIDDMFTKVEIDKVLENNTVNELMKNILRDQHVQIIFQGHSKHEQMAKIIQELKKILNNILGIDMENTPQMRTLFLDSLKETFKDWGFKIKHASSTLLNKAQKTFLKPTGPYIPKNIDNENVQKRMKKRKSV